MPFTLHGTCPLLEVFDMPRALAFYRDVLGFQVVQCAPPADQVADDGYGWVWLRRDGTELMLNTACDPDDVRPPAPDAARETTHGDTTLFIGRRELDALHEHLRAHGVAVAPPAITSYGMRQVTLRDPDGFGLCFQWSATG